MIHVREKSPHDIAWMNTLISESWGSTLIILQGREYHPCELAAFIAEQDSKRVGLLTYIFDQKSCEIITLNSLHPRLGIGTDLLNAVKEAAKDASCHNLKVFTTNDNVLALQFYQKYGFYLEKLIPKGVALDRQCKPEIPLKAENGIPIRDYLLLKMSL